MAVLVATDVDVGVNVVVTVAVPVATDVKVGVRVVVIVAVPVATDVKVGVSVVVTVVVVEAGVCRTAGLIGIGALVGAGVLIDGAGGAVPVVAGRPDLGVRAGVSVGGPGVCDSCVGVGPISAGAGVAGSVDSGVGVVVGVGVLGPTRITRLR